MPISFGRRSSLGDKKSKEASAAARTTILSTAVAHGKCCLVDLREPDAFRNGFIPGSYNVPDLACLAAARHAGLFQGRKVYLLAEDERQLQLCSSGDLGEGAELAGWFSPDAIVEWQKANSQIGSIDAIGSDTLAIQMAAWNTLLFDIYQDGEQWQPSHPAAMGFRLEDLPVCMDGLPVESSICLCARTTGLASFATSLLWSVGFHKASYLGSGRRIRFPLAS